MLTVSLTALQASESAVVLKGNSLTEFGEYSLTGNSNYEVLNNVAFRTWELNYPEVNKSFKVYMAPGNNNNCCFYVKGENFEIKYQKHENGFGATFVDNSMRTLRKKELLKQISEEKLNNQQIITTNERSIEEYLGLIACFMPLMFG
jgi:hypothetical protein